MYFGALVTVWLSDLSDGLIFLIVWFVWFVWSFWFHPTSYPIYSISAVSDLQKARYRVHQKCRFRSSASTDNQWCNSGYYQIFQLIRIIGVPASQLLQPTDKQPQSIRLIRPNQQNSIRIAAVFRHSVKVSFLMQELQHTSLVGAFHGHAHSHLCQLSHLTTYVQGLGLKDLETCKWIFLKSNTLASSTWYANTFHHQQAISTYFQYNNDLKVFANLSAHH